MGRYQYPRKLSKLEKERKQNATKKATQQRDSLKSQGLSERPRGPTWRLGIDAERDSRGNTQTWEPGKVERESQSLRTNRTQEQRRRTCRGIEYIEEKESALISMERR